MSKSIITFALFLTLISARAVNAQQETKIRKIGVLVSSSPSLNAARDEALRQGLRDQGYIEGQNIVIEYKYAEGKLDRRRSARRLRKGAAASPVTAARSRYCRSTAPLQPLRQRGQDHPPLT